MFFIVTKKYKELLSRIDVLEEAVCYLIEKDKEETRKKNLKKLTKVESYE